MFFTNFPNYAFKNIHGQIFLESSHPLLYAALVEANINLSVAAQRHAGQAYGNYSLLQVDNVSVDELGIINIEFSTCRRALTYLLCINSVMRSVKRSDFIYIFYPGYLAILAILACWLKRKPYAIYLRGDQNVFLPRILYFIKGSIFRKASFVLCTGSSVVDEMKRFNPNTESVVPMSPLLFWENDDTVSRQKNKNVTILFVGEMVRDKGIFELLDAFEELLGIGFVDIELIYVGDGGQRFEVESEIQTRNLRNSVQCLGLITNLEQLSRLFLSSSIFCLPTYHEGFPRVIYEAMRFSLPIVTTPVGQIPEVIEHDGNGLLCEPRCVTSLTLNLRRLLESAELCEKLGAASRQTLEGLLSVWGRETHGHQVLGWLERLGLLGNSSKR